MKQTKTDILRIFQQAFKKALVKQRLHEDRATHIPNESRREFLKVSIMGSAAIAGAGFMAKANFLNPMAENLQDIKIGILGAGVAGLHAAYVLKNANIQSTIYEASKRSGGRMFTAKDLMGKEITTELGGEFIDSIHDDILRLANEFGLELIDTERDKNLTKQVFYFGGKKYDANDLVKAFEPFVESIKQDIDSLPESITYAEPGTAEQWDQISVDAYIRQKGIKGWLRELLTVAFTTEYGMDTKEQSAINFLFLFDPEKTEDLFGESDERYKIAGGNQRIVDELAKRIGNIQLGYEVTKIKSKGEGYTVYFSNGKSRTFDYLICTIPFTKLRHVQLDIEGMSAVKKKCIKELGYGRNAKMFAGFKTRYWRKQGASGQTFSDQPFQLGWDSSQLQKGTAGAYTFLTGGTMSDRMKDMPLTKKLNQYLTQLNKIFPGALKNYNGKNGIFYWPTHPFTLGSYACYKVGQWTSIGGAEIEPIGNMFFAGEHCSADFQGFMNGGAETGRRAAEHLIELIKK